MTLEVDRKSLLVRVAGSALLASIESDLQDVGLTLGVTLDAASACTVSAWLARGAPGAASAFSDPADHLVAGFSAKLTNGSLLDVRPSPRRAVGPDLFALLAGVGGRFATLDHVWLRVHDRASARVNLPCPPIDLDPAVSPGEEALLDAIACELER